MSFDLKNFRYFIYLDSKILGAAKQIATFFAHQIFSVNETIVLLKSYKKGINKIEKFFTTESIPYQLVKPADLDKLELGVVFYPFNAQSNCRFVANRRLTHVFITHGESNKISSVKPIIRIYDFVVTAGKAGIDRFLREKIFTEYDVKLGKFIQMGDTFIGRTGLNLADTSEKVILYAPTWEGGIINENYSSLTEVDLIESHLIQASEKFQCKKIVIKPHPNTGHRSPEYKKRLLDLIIKLRKKGFSIVLYRKNIELSWFEQWKLNRERIILSENLSNFQAVFAFCDISAIETQLLNENIPYRIFMNNEHLQSLLTTPEGNIYQTITFSHKNPNLDIWLNTTHFIALRNYILTGINAKMSQRISLLTQKINHSKI